MQPTIFRLVHVILSSFLDHCFENLNSNFLFTCRRAFPGLSGHSQKRSHQPSTSACSSKFTSTHSKKRKERSKHRETWTHEFCVLAGVNDNKTPSKEQLWDLRKAGLGPSKVVFPDKNADHDEFIEVLENVFPKLKCGGGIQLLQATGGGGGQRNLKLLYPSEDGYSVPYLKGPMAVGQSVIYIRPLQIKLDRSAINKVYI